MAPLTSRMVAPDSPWISGGWRHGHFNEYQDFWAPSQKTTKLKSASKWMTSCAWCYTSLLSHNVLQSHCQFNIYYTILFWFYKPYPFVFVAGLPVSSAKDSDCMDSAVPVVTDSCGVYGTFYVDLTGSNLKTFNSPGRCSKMPHNLPNEQGTETIKIFTQPVTKSSPLCGREPLPWKQAIRPQPRMGVLRESWEKGQSKQGE